MKRSLSRTLWSLLLAITICFGISIVTFAAEKDSNVALKIEEKSASNVEMMSDTYGDYDTKEISPNGKVTLYPTLNNYVGLSRTFFLSTMNIYSDDNPSGTIDVWVYKPDGNLLKYFTIGGYERKDFKFTLPPAGRYTVDVESNINERIHVTAGWTK